MRKFFPICVLVLFANISLFGQQDCPSISVNGPSGIIEPGGRMIFNGIVTDKMTAGATYWWTVSTGEIIYGQGTLSIKVRSTLNRDENTTATLEIRGLPDGCVGTVSETAAIGCRLPEAITIDEYANISFDDEKLRIDNALKAFRSKPDSQLYIIKYYTKQSRYSRDRIKNLNAHISKNRIVPDPQFKIVLALGPHERTKIILVPPGVVPPTP